MSPELLQALTDHTKVMGEFLAAINTFPERINMKSIACDHEFEFSSDIDEPQMKCDKCGEPLEVVSSIELAQLRAPASPVEPEAPAPNPIYVQTVAEAIDRLALDRAHSFDCQQNPCTCSGQFEDDKDMEVIGKLWELKKSLKVPRLRAPSPMGLDPAKLPASGLGKTGPDFEKWWNEIRVPGYQFGIGRDELETAKQAARAGWAAATANRGEGPPPDAAPAAPQRIDQTVTGPRGNCYSACLAMMLGLPISEVPNFCDTPGLEADPGPIFQAAAKAWLAARGWGHITIEAHGPFFKRWFSRGYVMAAGMTSRGMMHSVIYKDGELWHDPHPSHEGLKAVQEVDLLFPLKPFSWPAPQGSPESAEGRQAPADELSRARAACTRYKGDLATVIGELENDLEILEAEPVRVALTWTKEKPKVEGWYWFRVAGKQQQAIDLFRIIDGKLTWYSNAVGLQVPVTWDLEYAGPITEPKEISP